MTTIAAIDPSLTSTGVAVITTNGQQTTAETWCRISKGHRTDTLTDRWNRIRTISADVLAFIEPCDLAVIEAPSYGSVGSGTWDRAGLWWNLVHRLTWHDTPIITIPPTTRAKFATGRGNAGKTEVAVATAKLWPGLELGSPLGVDDQWDALALASAGLVLAGLAPPFDMPAYRSAALAKVAFPESEAA